MTEPEPSTKGPGERLVTPTLLAAGIALILRLLAIVLWPPVYGGDALGRLEHAAETVWSPVHLPATSLVVWAVHRIHPAPVAQRVAFAILGSLACGAGALVAGRVAGRRAGLLAGLAFGTAPAILEWTVVPYQEGPFLLALLPGLLLLYTGATARALAAGALLLALATTVRYEGWYVLGVLLLVPPRPFRRLALGFVAAAVFPAAWVAWHGALTPSGTSSLHPGLSLDRLLDPLVCLGGTAQLMTPPLFLAALWGMAARRQGAEALPPDARRLLRALAALLVVTLAALAIVRPYEPRTNPRQTILPCAILAVFAGVALDHGERILPRILYPYPRPRRSLVRLAAAAIFLLPAGYGLLRCARASLADDPRIGHHLGRHLASILAPGELAIVDAPARTDYPELEPTVVRFARVNAGGAARSIVHAGAPSAAEAGAIRYVACIGGATAPCRAAASLGSRVPLPSPDPGVMLFGR